MKMEMRSEEEVNEAEKRANNIAWGNRDGGIIKNRGHSGNPESRARIEREVGMTELEKTFTDFGWGVMMGRLETLRWVQGDDWGNCDT